MSDEVVVGCMPNTSPSDFDDCKYTRCADCSIGIHHRPHVPEPSIKVCMDCFFARAEADDEFALMPPNAKAMSELQALGVPIDWLTRMTNEKKKP